MSNDYTKEIGYETLLADFKRYQKQTPRGVGMKRTGQNIYLQFKTPNTKRKPYACNCSFTLDGMVEALRKSKLVKEKLESLTSEDEFWDWYDKEIKNESQLVDDRITFEEAIKKVEDDFWSRTSRTKRRRDKSNPSDQSSWRETYGRFFEYLPQDAFMNIQDIIVASQRQKPGTKVYKHVVSAYKKLAEINKRSDIREALGDIDITQTEYKALENITLKDFLDWREQILDPKNFSNGNVNVDTRKAWLWAFSMQVVYGLRISEVFAIKNTHIDYVTKDDVTIPALIKSDDTSSLIYIGEKTLLGTTVKTGSRIARPQIPPKYPNLIEMLDIKNVLVPENKPKTKNTDRIRSFYSSTATQKLARWNAPTTQTHALRHLANINGIQAGIPQEVRAQSLGHTVQMNESVYKKRQGTQTTIDLLLNSNQNAIDFVTALAEAKKLVKDNESDKLVIAKLLSIIYQKRQDELIELL